MEVGNCYTLHCCIHGNGHQCSVQLQVDAQTDTYNIRVLPQPLYALNNNIWSFFPKFLNVFSLFINV